MQELVAAAGGRLAMCRAYANHDTAARLRGVLPLLERWGLMEVVLVPVRADAADIRLVQDAMAFAGAGAAVTSGARSCSSHSSYEDSSSGSDSEGGSTSRGCACRGGSGRGGSSSSGGDGAVADGGAWDGGLQPAVLCVSQDTDFAEPLRHLSERGVVTIAVSPHEPRRRTHAAMEPATYFRRLPLPSACCAAMQWRAQPPAPVSAAEAHWLAARLQQPAQEQAHFQPGAKVQGQVNAQQLVGGAPRHAVGGFEVNRQELSKLSGTESALGSAGTAAKPLASGPREELPVAQDVIGQSDAWQPPCAEQVAVSGLAVTDAGAPWPRGLVEFVCEGHPCPGVATRLWLNPAFTGS